MRPGASRVVFMCGPAGSGKSTVARGLERDGLVRLSFDETAWARGIRTMPLAEDDGVAIEAALRAQLLTLVEAGRDVVLDFSFWSRRMRDEYRALLAPHGVTPETVYVSTPRDVALGRVDARRMSHADDVVLPPELAAAFYDHFEVPTPDEGPLTIVSGAG